MPYIFLDESGDLGFDFSKKKTSKFFIITCIFTNKKRPIEKIIRKIFSGFSKKEIKSHNGKLHFFKEKPSTRRKLLKMLNEKDIDIKSIYLDKSKVFIPFHDEKHILYNYITNILLNEIYSNNNLTNSDTFEVVASQRETNRFLNDSFCKYIQKQAFDNHKIKVKVSIRTPHQEKCLQIADAISWTIFRNLEHKDNSYIEIIKNKSIKETPIFPK